MLPKSVCNSYCTVSLVLLFVSNWGTDYDHCQWRESLFITIQLLLVVTFAVSSPRGDARNFQVFTTKFLIIYSYSGWTENGITPSGDWYVPKSVLCTFQMNQLQVIIRCVVIINCKFYVSPAHNDHFTIHLSILSVYLFACHVNSLACLRGQQEFFLGTSLLLLFYYYFSIFFGWWSCIDGDWKMILITLQFMYCKMVKHRMCPLVV